MGVLKTGMSLGINLLLVDKNKVSALEKASFKSMGFGISTASSLKEIEDILNEKNLIDLVVLNFDNLQEETLSICSRLKKSHKDLPLIVTTTREASSFEKKIRAGGANLVIEQPVSRESFIEKVKILLSQKVRLAQRVLEPLNIEGVTLTHVKKKIKVTGKDLSLTGMLVYADPSVSLKKDDSVTIAFTLKTETNSTESADYKIKATIIRVEELKPENASKISLRFEKILEGNKKELMHYVDQNNDRKKKDKYYGQIAS